MAIGTEYNAWDLGRTDTERVRGDGNMKSQTAYPDLTQTNYSGRKSVK